MRLRPMKPKLLVGHCNGHKVDEMSRAQIKYDEVSQALSGARLGTYLRYSKNDVAGAFQLHHVNAQLAASFWEPLELFEVVLRNRLADCLTQPFGSNWKRAFRMLNEPRGKP